MYNLQTHIGFTNLWSNKPRFCIISSQRVKNGTRTPCSAWSGSKFFGFGFDFQENFGFGFTRVCLKLPFRSRVLKFRVYGFSGLKSKTRIYWILNGKMQKVPHFHFVPILGQFKISQLMLWKLKREKNIFVSKICKKKFAILTSIYCNLSEK